ncbi:tetratricopeptide repeat-containing sulfotransferase family protein [Primorskyibacter sp. 2E107]|uniref:tetratricopeptide repeat-containing sulfotransferase family protein n=1 Tax=Primorskyibacter sp. 2E107 TaxID=3403458 RepID=UPI003AF50657
MTSSAAAIDAAELASVNEDIRRIVQHQAAGRYEDAGALISRILGKHSGLTRLVHLKALNLAYLGERDEAKALLQDILSIERKDPSIMVDYGAILAQDGALDEATEQFRSAVEIAPNHAMAQANLGAALVIKQAYPEAIQHLERAVALDNTVLDPLINLATALIRVNSFDRAIDVLFRALIVDPQSAAAHSQLAHALFRRERPDSAEHHARRAIELAPDQVEPKLHLGNILASAGRLNEATKVLLSIAGRPPFGIPALARVVNLRKTREDSPEYALLQNYESRIADIPREPRTTLHFALAKAADDLGQYGKAMDHYHAGNALNAEQHPYDETSAAKQHARLLALSSPALLSRCSGGGGIDAMTPIFICGMPRSGTTLMDQMFSRHPDVQAGGELPGSLRALARNKQIRAALEQEIPPESLTADDFTRLGEDYISVLHGEGLRGAFVSDKMPANYMYIGLLALALPKAKFLIMRRHPMDCLLSNYMQNFGSNQTFSTDFTTLGSVYRRFDAMANHWAALLPDRVRQVPYEDVVAAPEPRMRAVLDFVGLDWREDVLDHTKSSHQVNTASFAQVRQPIYGTSVARWRRYGPLLRDLAAEVKDSLTEDERAAAGLDPAG